MIWMNYGTVRREDMDNFDCYHLVWNCAVFNLYLYISYLYEIFLISIKGLLPCFRLFSYLLSFILNVNLILHKDHSFYLDDSAAFNYSLLIDFRKNFNQTLHLNFKNCTKKTLLPAVNLEVTNRFCMYLA